MSDVRMPPHSEETEKSVLGAILLEPDAIYLVMSILKPDMFYTSNNAFVFECMLSLTERGQKPDLLSVMNEMLTDRKNEKFELYELTRMTEQISTSRNIEAHAKILVELYIKRSLIKLGNKLMVDGYDETVDSIELLDRTSKELLSISTGSNTNGFVKIDKAIIDTITESDRKKSSGDKGVTFKHGNLSFIVPSIQAGELTIIAARPSVGKTAFSLEIAKHAAMKGKRVGIFSMEMNKESLVKRMLPEVTKIPFTAIYHWDLDETQHKRLNEGAAQLADLPIFIDDTFNNSPRVLYGKALTLKMKHGLDLLIIDYLQLIGTDKKRVNSNTNQDLTEISRACKGMAMDLGIPVIALSQLSRAVEQQGRSKPRLSDLRDSGAIEQDADQVMFLYRIDDAEFGEVKKVGISVAKQRNGALGDIVLEFDGNFQSFTESTNPF